MGLLPSVLGATKLIIYAINLVWVEFKLLPRVPGTGNTLSYINFKYLLMSFAYSWECQEQPEPIKYFFSNKLGWVCWLLPGVPGATTNSSNINFEKMVDKLWLFPRVTRAGATHQIFIVKYLWQFFGCCPKRQEHPKIIEYWFQITLGWVLTAPGSARSSQ